MSYFEQVEEAAAALKSRVGRPGIGVVLGSGLGGVVDLIDSAVSIPYAELPHWPPARVEGHDGRVVAGTLRGRPIIALAGRSHVYEGIGVAAVTFAVRALARLGVRVLVLTNAAGGINPSFAAGSLMVIDDHINLMGVNPLAGPHDARFGAWFQDLSEVYSARLRLIAGETARRAGIPLPHGVYAALSGPSYETPAEIRYLRAIGADAVGMSTVPEAIAARQMGVEILAVSCISNLAAGMLPQPLDHADVLETTRRARRSFSTLLEGIVGQL